MTRLSTHVLDTSQGKPAAGIPVALYEAARLISENVTDSDGRCQNLLPHGVTLTPGTYRIVFQVNGCFYPEVSVSFKVTAGADHFHIPLLMGQFGYTTYRGS